MAKNSFSDKELEKIIAEFQENMNVQFEKDNLIDEIIYAKSKKEKLRLIDEALQKYHDDLDFLSIRIETQFSDMDERLQELQKLIKIGDEQMKKEGFLPDDVGDFYGIFETRPYIKLRRMYLTYLIVLGRFSLALEEAEYIMKLNESDNSGARYLALNILAYLEKAEQAEELLKKYDDEESAPFFLPMAILYYKLGQFEKARDYLLKTYAVNRNLKKFLTLLKRNSEELHFVSNECMMDSLEELISEYQGNLYLYASAQFFPDWAIKELKKK